MQQLSPRLEAAIVQAYRATLSPRFGRIYVRFALGTLLVTSAWWSWLGSRVQLGNADQLVNPYLFQDNTTFHGAQFPGQHTFLIKWPLFYLVKLMHYSS